MNASHWKVACAVLPAILAIAWLTAPNAPVQAAIPYNNPGPFVLPISGPVLPSPASVRGKQYSHFADEAINGVADPAQIVFWDGLGGTVDDSDYSLALPPYSATGDFQIDALANERDSLFTELLNEGTHLVYSVDVRGTTTPTFGLLPFSVPSGGPLSLSDTVKGGSNFIGGAGDVSFEMGTLGGALPSNVHGIWASQALVNGQPNPVAIDSLELWGGEPGVPGSNDAGKYSVETDLSTGVGGVAYSVWNYSTTSGHSGYVLHSMVVDLVRNLLGEPDLPAADINLDALMVLDTDTGRGPGTGPSFFNPGDKIIFSIRQIASASAGGGFLATGSEIFVLDGASTQAVPVGQFLTHGGHVWNKAYALANMVGHFSSEGGAVDVQLDLNSLEAVSGVPEPTSIVLLLAGLTGLGLRRVRRGRA
jgi:hypothetical protein